MENNEMGYVCEGHFCEIHLTRHEKEFSEIFERVGRPDSDIFIISKDCPTFEKEEGWFGGIVAENEFFVAFAPYKEVSPDEIEGSDG